MTSNIDKFDAILDMNDPKFVEKFADAVGVSPGEALHIITPQFKRTDGLTVPTLDIDFASLPQLSEPTLKAMGCQKWDEPDAEGNFLWLYPAEWYDRIPEGFPLTDINGEASLFKRGETDDDMRFGALAYGFMRCEKAGG